MKPVLFSFDILGKHIDVITYIVFNIFLNPFVFIILGTYFLSKKRISYKVAFTSVALITASVLIGARITHVLLSYEHYLDTGTNPFTISGGFTMFGGFVLAVPVAIWLSRKLNISIWSFLDSVSPGWALGIFFNKIGCFLNGCCFGVPTYVPWGVVYPEGSIPHFHYYSVELSKIAMAAGGVLPYRIHPVQLYESAIGLLGFLLLLIVYKRHTVAGLSFSAFAVIYSFSRLILNQFREIPSNLSVNTDLVFLLYAAVFCGTLAVFINRITVYFKQTKALNCKFIEKE